MSQREPGGTQMSRGEKVVTGLTMAMLAAAFTAGGFGAVADGGRPSSQVHLREAYARVPALPLWIKIGPRMAGRLAGRGSGCQLADAVETAWTNAANTDFGRWRRLREFPG
jgi:hypothetical protein